MQRLAFTLAILVVGAASIAPSARQTGQDLGSFLAANHFIVEYAGAQRTLEAAATRVGGTIDWVHPVGLAKISGLTGEQATQLATMPGILSVTRDVMIQWLSNSRDRVPESITRPTGPLPQSHDPADAFFFLFNLQWNMQIIDADDAWAAGFRGSPNVRVAVIDTGIDPYHIDLAGLVDAGSSRAFTPSLNPIPPTWGDDHFHGTHVASMIATNGIGTSGVAPHTTLIAVKVVNNQGSGVIADLIGGILHAADVQADVINMSLGLPFDRNMPGFARLAAAIEKAVSYANSKGALVVSAAGNDGVDLTHLGSVAALPCEAGAGICVSATALTSGTPLTDQLASYSNFGRPISLAAPGGEFTPGIAVLGPCSSLSLVLPCGPFDYIGLAGTSVATPHVSGAAALLDAQHGGSLRGGQLKAVLEQTADDLGNVGSDIFYGRGRLNVHKAVTR